MDAWSAGSLLVIDVKVNVLRWCRFSWGKTSFSKWHIGGLQSPCPTHHSGFGAGGKRHRKQQCWARARAMVGRKGQNCVCSRDGDHLLGDWCWAQAAQGDLSVTACPCPGWAASPPDLCALQLQHTAFPGSGPLWCFLWKKPAFCLMQGGDNFIRLLVSVSLAPLGLFATTSVTMSCVIYPQYLYQKYRNNNLIPLCRAFWFNNSLHWVVFPLIIWYFMKTSCCGVRHHSLIFWYSAPDSCH